MNTNSKELILAKCRDDLRKSKEIISIVDGKFEHKLSYDQDEPYQLVFKDSYENAAWRTTVIFPENGEIQVILFPDNEFDKNEIKGGDLNKEFSTYYKERELTFYEPRKKIRSEHKAIQEKNLSYDSEATKQLQLKIDSLKSAIYKYESQYIKNSHSTMAYYILYRHTFNNDKIALHFEDIQDNYQILSERYPNHPYTSFIGQKLASFNAIKVGGDFIDFTAPDLEGNPITFSNQLKDKITLLDLWGSWCGPCIRTSRTMIPIYEFYKEKGFNVIGVAREFKDTNALERTLEREKFPWNNLLELDDQQQIWLKYGIPNTGGKTFLIDQEGKILAISPTADELTKILEREL